MPGAMLTFPCRDITLTHCCGHNHHVWASNHLLTFSVTPFLWHTFLTEDMPVITSDSSFCLFMFGLLTEILYEYYSHIGWYLLGEILGDFFLDILTTIALNPPLRKFGINFFLLCWLTIRSLVEYLQTSEITKKWSQA